MLLQRPCMDMLPILERFRALFLQKQTFIRCCVERKCRRVVKLALVTTVAACCLLSSASYAQIEPAEYSVYKDWLEEAFITPDLKETVISDHTFDFWHDLTEIPLHKKREIAKLQIETLKDYRFRNRNQQKLVNDFRVGLPVYLYPHADLMASTNIGTGENTAKSPQFRIAFSRVGFNKKGTQALIHVHYKENSDSKLTFGYYFVMSRERGTWIIKQRTRAWEY